ncbi:hypothetical protein [Azospirillum halopraeferens]|uniref:hypothetical protein n=1 Tax=Azospirillum halopraeferens TaxID=34010 RepID=UPI0004242D27|nr:hypothetical protein [Azospirillum halopraeferens]
MTATAGIEGAVAIRLLVSAGRVREARVTIRRPAAARALAGRPLDEAMRLVPLLFSVCGTAQGVAAATAVEQALAFDPAPAHAAARALMVEAETAASHAWQALVDWPRLLGEPPAADRLAPLRAAAAAVAPALYPDGNGLRPGGGDLRPDPAALRRAADVLAAGIAADVLGGDPLPGDADALAARAAAGRTPAARLLHRVLQPDLAGFGACAVAALPEVPASWFAERLAADDGFAARPHHDGAPALTGPLARRWHHPLVADLRARHGTGAAVHLAARLVELAEAPERLRAAATALVPARRGAPATRSGIGAAVVETARGRLAQRIVVEDGQVADLRSVAPTEWNFAPDGPLARGLTGAAADAGLERRAAVLVAALDPCVASAITVAEA